MCDQVDRMLWSTLAATVISTCIGCGSSDRLKTYQVEGRVEYASGSPFNGGVDGSIIFESIEHRLSATGAIDTEGRFTLGTYEPGDGAVAGKHRVAISPPVPEGDPDRRSASPLIHPKFLNLDSSGLEAEVTTSGKNDIVLTIE